MKTDRTIQAVVYKQLNAMDFEKYTVGSKNDKGMKLWDMGKNEVLENINFLKRQNALVEDIYIRPSGDKNSGLILLDNVSR